MAEENKPAPQGEPSEADISARTGMGEPKNTPTEDQNAIDAGDPKEDADSKDEDALDASDDEGEDDDSEDSDKDEEEKDEPKDKKHTVPYSRFKSEKTKRQGAERELGERTELATAIATLTNAIAAMKGKGEAEPDEIETEAKALAAEMGMEAGLGADQLSKVLRKAVGLAEKRLGGKIPQEVQDKLKGLEALQKSGAARAEVEHFDGEWNQLLPALEKRYPNATKEMLAEAKDEMDKISHSEKGGKVLQRGDSEEFLPHDLDYVFFKNRKAFDTILKASKHSRSGESAHEIHREEAPEGEERDLDPETMTPETIKRVEQSDRVAAAAQGASKTGIRITDPVKK